MWQMLHLTEQLSRDQIQTRNWERVQIAPKVGLEPKMMGLCAHLYAPTMSSLVRKWV